MHLFVHVHCVFFPLPIPPVPSVLPMPVGEELFLITPVSRDVGKPNRNAKEKGEHDINSVMQPCNNDVEALAHSQGPEAKAERVEEGRRAGDPGKFKYVCLDYDAETDEVASMAGKDVVSASAECKGGENVLDLKGLDCTGDAGGVVFWVRFGTRPDKKENLDTYRPCNPCHSGREY